MTATEDASNHSLSDAILAEYYLRLEQGETIDREAFLAEHPDYADEFRLHFEDAEAISQMIQSATDSLDVPCS